MKRMKLEEEANLKGMKNSEMNRALLRRGVKKLHYRRGHQTNNIGNDYLKNNITDEVTIEPWEVDRMQRSKESFLK